MDRFLLRPCRGKTVKRHAFHGFRFGGRRGSPRRRSTRGYSPSPRWGEERRPPRFGAAWSSWGWRYWRKGLSLPLASADHRRPKSEERRPSRQVRWSAPLVRRFTAKGRRSAWNGLRRSLKAQRDSFKDQRRPFKAGRAAWKGLCGASKADRAALHTFFFAPPQVSPRAGRCLWLFHHRGTARDVAGLRRPDSSPARIVRTASHAPQQPATRPGGSHGRRSRHASGQDRVL